MEDVKLFMDTQTTLKDRYKIKIHIWKRYLPGYEQMLSSGV